MCIFWVGLVFLSASHKTHQISSYLICFFFSNRYSIKPSRHLPSTGFHSPFLAQKGTDVRNNGLCVFIRFLGNVQYHVVFFTAFRKRLLILPSSPVRGKIDIGCFKNISYPRMDPRRSSITDQKQNVTFPWFSQAATLQSPVQSNFHLHQIIDIIRKITCTEIASLIGP